MDRQLTRIRHPDRSRRISHGRAGTGTPPPWRDGRRGATARRRRAGPIRAVAASMLAVLALVGCVTAILLLAIDPTATRLEGQVAGLDHRLAASHSALVVLQRRVGRADRRSSQAAHDIRRLGRRVGGLQRTVSGLQAGADASREQTIGLGLCVAGLERALSGLSLQTRSVDGRLARVGLSEPARTPGGCPELVPPG